MSTHFKKIVSLIYFKGNLQLNDH